MKKAIALSAGALLLTAGAAQADVFASDSPGIAIPDNDPAGLTLTIVITQDETIKDLNIGMWISHTWQGDLIATLTKVGGPTVNLMTRAGSTMWGGSSTFGYSADGFGTSAGNPLILDDDVAGPNINFYDGATDGLASYAGPANAEGLLSAFDGLSTQGTWELFISDNAGGDTGTLNYWQLDFLSNSVPAPGALALLGLAGVAGLGRRRR